MRESPQKAHMLTFLTMTRCLSLPVPQPRRGQISQLPSPCPRCHGPFQCPEESLGDTGSQPHLQCSLVHVTVSGPSSKRGGLNGSPVVRALCKANSRCSVRSLRSHLVGREGEAVFVDTTPPPPLFPLPLLNVRTELNPDKLGSQLQT